MVTVDRDQCLLIYPTPEWEQIEQQLMSLPSLHRAVAPPAAPDGRPRHRNEIDSHGRIACPPELREFAGLQRIAWLVGQGKRLELWDEARWNVQCEEWMKSEQVRDGSRRRTRFVVALMSGARGVNALDEHKPVLVEEALTALGLAADSPAPARVCMSTQRSDAAVTQPASLSDLGPKDACSRSTATHRRSLPLGGASTRTRGYWWSMLRSARSNHWSRHMAKDVPVKGFCSTSACLRRSSTRRERGFSFQQDGPLDMRMDPTHGNSAAQWLARAAADEIRDVIGTLGEERFAGRIARVNRRPARTRAHR